MQTKPGSAKPDLTHRDSAHCSVSVIQQDVLHDRAAIGACFLWEVSAKPSLHECFSSNPDPALAGLGISRVQGRDSLCARNNTCTHGLDGQKSCWLKHLRDAQGEALLGSSLAQGNII